MRKTDHIGNTRSSPALWAGARALVCVHAIQGRIGTAVVRAGDNASAASQAFTVAPSNKACSVWERLLASVSEEFRNYSMGTAQYHPFV